MIARLLLAVVVATSVFVPAAAFAARMSRTEIKSMPMLERPYRVGHFYGNTARRNTRPSGQTE